MIERNHFNLFEAFILDGPAGVMKCPDCGHLTIEHGYLVGCMVSTLTPNLAKLSPSGVQQGPPIETYCPCKNTAQGLKEWRKTRRKQPNSGSQS